MRSSPRPATAFANCRSAISCGESCRGRGRIRARDSRALQGFVTPAKAGVQFIVSKSKAKLDSSFRWNDEHEDQSASRRLLSQFDVTMIHTDAYLRARIVTHAVVVVLPAIGVNHVV